MPKLTQANSTETQAALSVSLMDVAGEIARVSINADPAEISASRITTFHEAIGNASNAQVIGYTLSSGRVDNPGMRAPLDEAESSVATKAILIFQSVSHAILRVEVPAPDQSLFLSDGNTIDRTNPQVVALVNAILALIGNHWTLVRGFLGMRTRKAKINNLRPALTPEPTDEQLPPPQPGVPAVIP